MFQCKPDSLLFTSLATAAVMNALVVLPAKYSVSAVASIYGRFENLNP